MAVPAIPHILPLSCLPLPASFLQEVKNHSKAPKSPSSQASSMQLLEERK